MFYHRRDSSWCGTIDGVEHTSWAHFNLILSESITQICCSSISTVEDGTDSCPKHSSICCHRIFLGFNASRGGYNTPIGTVLQATREMVCSSDSRFERPGMYHHYFEGNSGIELREFDWKYMILKFLKLWVIYFSKIYLYCQNRFGDLLFENFWDCPSCTKKVRNKDPNATSQWKGIIPFIHKMGKLVVNVSRIYSKNILWLFSWMSWLSWWNQTHLTHCPR